MKHGFSLIELLISSSIALVILAMFVQQVSYTSKVHVDNSAIQSAHNEAKAVMNIIGMDLRMLGNGIPFEVNNFDIGIELENAAATRGYPDVTYPILISDTSNTQIKYRLNETGDVYMVNSPFTINSTTFNILLHTTVGLLPGDRIYITNKSLTGNDGFWGRIQNTSAGVNAGTSTITIDVTSFGYWKSPGAAFNVGSILEPVTDITLENSVVDDVNVITKNNGISTLTLARNATFTIQYYDENDTEINRIPGGSPTTLLASDINERTLRYVVVTVNVSTDKNMQALGGVGTSGAIGTPYTASTSQAFGIKNLKSK